MREILFRGKAKESHKWLLGDFLMAVSDGVPWILPTNEAEEVKVFPETVGQFTGLTDKNGKKIFEGDIVRHYNNAPCVNQNAEELGVVFWDDAYCGWRRTSNGALHHGVVETYRMSGSCRYEVIGNIHDNPELMEE